LGGTLKSKDKIHTHTHTHTLENDV
jgi:hypothetical protein